MKSNLLKFFSATLLCVFFLTACEKAQEVSPNGPVTLKGTVKFSGNFIDTMKCSPTTVALKATQLAIDKINTTAGKPDTVWKETTTTYTATATVGQPFTLSDIATGHYKLYFRASPCNTDHYVPNVNIAATSGTFDLGVITF